eukprot:scaffold7377_cov389-Prasinococcus_capsulatus_cf.AAC.1
MHHPFAGPGAGGGGGGRRAGGSRWGTKRPLRRPKGAPFGAPKRAPGGLATGLGPAVGAAGRGLDGRRPARTLWRHSRRDWSDSLRLASPTCPLAPFRIWRSRQRPPGHACRRSSSRRALATARRVERAALARCCLLLARATRRRMMTEWRYRGACSVAEEEVVYIRARGGGRGVVVATQSRGHPDGPTAHPGWWARRSRERPVALFGPAVSPLTSLGTMASAPIAQQGLLCCSSRRYSRPGLIRLVHPRAHRQAAPRGPRHSHIRDLQLQARRVPCYASEKRTLAEENYQSLNIDGKALEDFRSLEHGYAVFGKGFPVPRRTGGPAWH